LCSIFIYYLRHCFVSSSVVIKSKNKKLQEILRKRKEKFLLAVINEVI